MKKFVKSVLKITGFLATLSLINNSIKKKSDLSLVSGAHESDDLYYDSRYGKIRYRVCGDSVKPKILLLHGLVIGGSMNEFTNLTEHLISDYQVFKIDMLGFGHSDKPDISYNSYLYTTLISEFIADIVGEKVSIVANGHCADFAFMVRELNEEIVDELYLINPNGFVNETYGDIQSKIFRCVANLPIIGTTITNILSSRICMRKYLGDECYFSEELVTSSLVDNYYYNAHFNCENNKHALADVFTNFIKVDTKKKILETQKQTNIILGEYVTKYDAFKIKKELSKNENIRVDVVIQTRELVASEKADFVYEMIKESI